MDQLFSQRADEFDARIRAADIASLGSVDLVYHCTTADGEVVPEHRAKLEPTMKFEGCSDEFAESMLRKLLHDNVHAMVREAPAAPTMLNGGDGRHAYPYPVVIKDFALVLRDA